MVSPGQKAANRLNAKRSTGPKTEAGRIVASVNAIKHGLSAPLDHSPWAIKARAAAELLEAEGFAEAEATEMAKLIADYERNVAYQQQRYANNKAGTKSAPGLGLEAKESLALADKLAQIQQLKQTHQLGFGTKLTKDIEKFFRHVGGRHAKAIQKEAKSIDLSADRYLSRAAHQMVRGVRKI